MSEEAAAEFHRLRAQDGPHQVAALDAVWAALDPLAVDDLLGAWRGGEFTTGHPLNGSLQRARWHGKHFVSADEVRPLVCVGADGELYSDTDLGHGEATLWMVEFRGEVTASMVYDGQAVIDHFKRVDADTVMGIMNSRADRKHRNWFYFWLERDDVPLLR